jgi:hypothetical protein
MGLFHSNEGAPVRFIDFVNGADVRVIQGRGGLGFTPEAAEGFGIFRYWIGKELESHKAAEFEIFSLVDNPHPAAAGLLNNAVVRDGLADHAKACYGGSVGKSTKAVELAVSQKGLLMT